MALIYCTECGRQVSDKAAHCPNCGCPIVSNNGEVMIRIPALGNPFFSQKAVIIDNDTNEILWSGRQGEIAQFHINSPKNITIKFSKNAMVSGVKEIYGCVYANKKYTCTLDHGMHMFATYHLAEVDIMV